MQRRLPVVVAIAAAVTLGGCDARSDHAMPASTPDPHQPVVTLTAGAIALLRQFAGERQLADLFVLVAVKRDGDGFRYFIDLGQPQRDAVAYTWEGVRLQIDRASARYLQGTVIDASDDGHGHKAFKFDNPNVAGTLPPEVPDEMPPRVRFKQAH